MNQLGLLTKRIKLSQRFKSGRLKKWVDYWMNVGIDYKEAFTDIAKDSRKKPLKSSIIIAGLSGVGYAISSNPDEQDFKNSLQRYLNESAIYGDKIRNKDVDNFYNYLIDCFNNDLIRRISLGICSILWIDNYSKVNGIYKSQCAYLKPRYLTFRERIVDVGFLGTWWNIRNKHTYYDINEEEWNRPNSSQSKGKR